MAKPVLTERFLKALNLAFEVHKDQTRKAGGKNKSYFGTHLMAVCSYVQEVGGNEDEAIAAILHDSVEDRLDRLAEIAGIEDCGHLEKTVRVFAWIKEEFGEDACAIIRSVTDDKLPSEWKTMPKTWRHEWLRKSIEEKAQKLASASDSVRLVKACDTLHNLRSLLQDRTENGPSIWKSFALGCEGTIWKFERMTEVFEEHGPAVPAVELRKTLDRFKKVCEDDRTLKISK